MAAVLVLLRRPGSGPRHRAHRAPRGGLGDGPVPRRSDGRPVETVYAQHSGAERCDWKTVEQRGGHPVVYPAHGSHASYLRAGVRDRTFPDPNDEADGRGTVVRPRLVRITADAPRWMRWPGRWGGARARWWNPVEQDSPVGPAFQLQGRWFDPDGWAGGAHLPRGLRRARRVRLARERRRRRRGRGGRLHPRAQLVAAAPPTPGRLNGMLSRVAIACVLVPASLAAGVLPVALLVIANVSVGPIDNSAYTLLPVLGHRSWRSRSPGAWGCGRCGSRSADSSSSCSS